MTTSRPSCPTGSSSSSTGGWPGLGDERSACCASRPSSGSASTSASSRTPCALDRGPPRRSARPARRRAHATWSGHATPAVIVDDEDGMEFRHAVVRAALLGQMSAARRQRLHRDIATVLERTASSAPDRAPRGARPPPRPGPLTRGAALVPPRRQGGHRRASTSAPSELAERGLELLARHDRRSGAALRPAHRPRHGPAPRRARDDRRRPDGRRGGDRRSVTRSASPARC